ncbi:MAG TPA: diaminopropionate ammonia-lyase, partial [Candidatus Rifleibacterium sp.]|nr:diaminopropionate ammonia-lyase [Candidatus Rifleibacterium sp.]
MNNTRPDLKWLFNQHQNPDLTLCQKLFSPEVARKARRFHRQIPGFKMSPLLALPQLAQMFGVGGIWVKDESERLQLNSFKVL